MEGTIVRPIEAMEPPPLTTILSGVERLRSHIETDKEVREVETNTQTIGQGNLLIELREVELAPRLGRRILQGPYITRIHKRGRLRFPDKFRAVLKIQQQFHVARLFHEIVITIGGIATRT